MLLSGANIEATNRKKWTPIFEGCKEDRVDAIKLLLLHRADIMARNVEGKRPLHWAVWYGHRALVQLFVEHGVDVAAQGLSGGDLLRYAPIRGHLKIALMLLTMGLQQDSSTTLEEQHCMKQPNKATLPLCVCLWKLVQTHGIATEMVLRSLMWLVRTVATLSINISLRNLEYGDELTIQVNLR
jgi:ankyrin repeat protein